MREVGTPFLNEVSRHIVYSHAQQVFDLGRKYGHGDTGGEAYDDRIGDILDDGAQFQHTQEDEEDTCHQRGNRQSLYAILLDDACHDDDEGTCRTAYLHLASAECGDDEACHHGGDDTFLGRYAGSDGESDSQRQRHDAHDDACHRVGGKRLAVVILDDRCQFRAENILQMSGNSLVHNRVFAITGYDIVSKTPAKIVQVERRTK